MGGDPGIDISFLNQLIKRLDEVIKSSAKREVYSKSFQSLLSNASTQDPTIKASIKKVLQGINQLDNSQMVGLDKSSPKETKITTPAMPNSTNVDVLGASNKMQIPGWMGSII